MKFRQVHAAYNVLQKSGPGGDEPDHQAGAPCSAAEHVPTAEAAFAFFHQMFGNAAKLGQASKHAFGSAARHAGKAAGQAGKGVAQAAAATAAAGKAVGASLKPLPKNSPPKKTNEW